MNSTELLSLLLNSITLWMVYDMRAHSKKKRRREFQFVTTKRLINFGEVKPIPDIDENQEKEFARLWLSRHKSLMKFTEDECLQTWRDIGGTRETYVKLMDKWSAHGIIKRKDPNATRGTNAAWIATDERGTVKRIQWIAGIHSPVGTSPTAKSAGNRPKK